MQKISEIFEKDVLQWSEDIINHDTGYETLHHAINLTSPQIAVKFAEWLKSNFTNYSRGATSYWIDTKHIITEFFEGHYITKELWEAFLIKLKNNRK